MKTFLFYLVQWTWGLPVNLVGLIVYLFFKVSGRKSERFQYATITYIPGNWGGLSLGLFIFMNPDRPEEWLEDTRIHEYGHTWQCLVLGPLYYLVIAVPSMIWCNFKPCINYRKKNDVSYYWLYCEHWANVWGEKFSGLKQSFNK